VGAHTIVAYSEYIKEKTYRVAATAGIMMLVVLPFTYRMYSDVKRGESVEQTMTYVKRHLLKNGGKKTLLLTYTKRNAEVLPYYFGYKKVPGFEIRHLDDDGFNPADFENIFLVKDEHLYKWMNDLYGYAYGQVPEKFVLISEKNGFLLYGYKK